MLALSPFEQHLARIQGPLSTSFDVVQVASPEKEPENDELVPPLPPNASPISSSEFSIDSLPSTPSSTSLVIDAFVASRSRVLRANALLAVPAHHFRFPLVVAPALPGDLEPPDSLRVIPMPPTAVTEDLSCQPQPNSVVLVARSVVEGPIPGEYTISTNPPNPRTTFRMGDWIRNTSCIGCGNARSNHPSPIASPNAPNMTSASRPQPSPRFATTPTTYSNQNYAPLPSPPHPLLTPSGRAFAVGGRVQNVSTDPLAPCVMYWPDNEPLPEQGQIRPGYLSGLAQPPILNTGNRGPISHQPGDWICLKCNYLNWRRRKVCQTCLPYAEGNGDSISSAVQAERIALLSSVLEQTQISSPPLHTNLRSQSLTPPDARRPFMDQSPLHQRGPGLSKQVTVAGRAIYQTSGIPGYLSSQRMSSSSSPRHQISSHQPQPLPPHFNPAYNSSVHAPAPLLPGFLQDIVQSPTLSPASTSSADLSPEEVASLESEPSRLSRPASKERAIPNIWSMQGNEYQYQPPRMAGSGVPGNMTPPQVLNRQRYVEHSPPYASAPRLSLHQQVYH
ncbi:hypothetical protein DL96DRAFT_1705634 [Flagelloscypha sp. PMI_526]|nr:hypothetical protein DL96DRAFT_1705634 [Flagelloscypha sp. PMI_526]